MITASEQREENIVDLPCVIRHCERRGRWRGDRAGRGTLAAACLLWLALTAPSAAQSCIAGFKSTTQIDLYFGRNIGEVTGVSEEAWARFLDEEITPRFPDGLSVADIAGQWKDAASGRIVREPGKRVTIIVDPTELVRRHIGDVIGRYKARHSQQSVLMTEQSVCAAY